MKENNLNKLIATMDVIAELEGLGFNANHLREEVGIPKVFERSNLDFVAPVNNQSINAEQRVLKK